MIMRCFFLVHLYHGVILKKWETRFGMKTGVNSEFSEIIQNSAFAFLEPLDIPIHSIFTFFRFFTAFLNVWKNAEYFFWSSLNKDVPSWTPNSDHPDESIKNLVKDPSVVHNGINFVFHTNIHLLHVSLLLTYNFGIRHDST